MRVKALKPFEYSKDGFTPKSASTGDIVLMPDHLVAGLIDAGFVEAMPEAEPEKRKSGRKSKRGAPENRAVGPAPENKSGPVHAESNAAPVASRKPVEGSADDADEAMAVLSQAGEE